MGKQSLLNPLDHNHTQNRPLSTGFSYKMMRMEFSLFSLFMVRWISNTYWMKLFGFIHEYMSCSFCFSPFLWCSIHVYYAHICANSFFLKPLGWLFNNWTFFLDPSMFSFWPSSQHALYMNYYVSRSLYSALIICRHNICYLYVYVLYLRGLLS